VRKVLIPAIAFSAAIPLFLLGNIPEAHAATSCYGPQCTGKLAANTTCASDGEVVEQATIYDVITGADIGYIQLKYSPSCRATWARVIADEAAASGSVGTTTARVISSDSSISVPACNGSGVAGTGCNTEMIDDVSPLTSVANGIVPGQYVTKNGQKSQSSGEATTSPPF
jgi:hypothetical protein